MLSRMANRKRAVRSAVPKDTARKTPSAAEPRPPKTKPSALTPRRSPAREQNTGVTPQPRVSPKKASPESRAAAKPTNIDEYLAQVDGETRELLQQLRRTIHQLVPEVSECISYSMPAFRYHGKVIAGFLATKRGASYFPFSRTTLDTKSNLLKGYSRTKSALHFSKQHPLPQKLVDVLLRARIAEVNTAES